MRYVATNVQEAVVAGSGHWLMEERPAETVSLIRNFLDASAPASVSAEERLSPSEYVSIESYNISRHTSMIGPGITTNSDLRRDIHEPQT